MAGWEPLINLGAIGCVLAWFMFRSEPRMTRIEEAIDRNTRAQVLLAMALDVKYPVIKERTQDLLTELDDAEKARKGK